MIVVRENSGGKSACGLSRIIRRLLSLVSHNIGKSLTGSQKRKRVLKMIGDFSFPFRRRRLGRAGREKDESAIPGFPLFRDTARGSFGKGQGWEIRLTATLSLGFALLAKLPFVNGLLSSGFTKRVACARTANLKEYVQYWLGGGRGRE